MTALRAGGVAPRQPRRVLAIGELSRHGQDMVDVIEAAVAGYNPDIILTRSNQDQHHQAVHMVSLRAARQTGQVRYEPLRLLSTEMEKL